MSDRPIIFSGPMVQALLGGRKTQTRLVLKPQPQPFDALFSDAGKWWTGDCETGEVYERLRLPYAAADRLWVREAWAAGACAEGLSPTCLHQGFWMRDNGGLWYRADEAEPAHPVTPRGRWRPSIHMPRWASRLTLAVTDVRVQRLQEISETDAIAEGCKGFVSRDGEDGISPQEEYRDLWDSLHGPDAWAENPWVAAITFSVERRNIDARTVP